MTQPPDPQNPNSSGQPAYNPDPNNFDGEVRVWTTKKKEWESVPLLHGESMGRGLGLGEMAFALQTGQPHRASGELALHVVETMEAFHVSARTGRKAILKSTCPQPAPLSEGLPQGHLV